MINSREISLFKIGMFVEDFVFRHSGAEPPENVPDRDAQPSDARLPASFPGFDLLTAKHRISRTAAMTETEAVRLSV